MNISRTQWLAAWTAGIAVHLIVLAAALFAHFGRDRPPEAPEGVMVSLDSLDAGPPPQAQPSEAPIDAPVPQAEAASAAPAETIESADTGPAAVAEAPEPAATIGPEPAASNASPASSTAAASMPDTIEPVPAIESTPDTRNAVAVSPIEATDAVQPQESVTAETPDVATVDTRAVDEPANGAFGSSDEATDDYIVRLRAWLERHKQYPVAARRTETEGTVRLYIAVNDNGAVLARRIDTGSGSSILDNAALRMLERAEPLPPMPAAMQRNRLELVVPVEFSLGDF